MSMCPVCNGLADFYYICPQCSHELEDKGRMSDYFADYSPYRELDDINMSNGLPDVEQHQCVHIYYCHSCGYEGRIMIQEI